MALFKPEFGLMFWMLVVFILLFVVLAKFAWPVIMKSLDERADLIDQGVEFSRNAKKAMDEAQVNAQSVLAEAQQQQLEILKEAAQLKSRIIEEARKAASVEAKKVIEAATLSIEQSRREAELQLRKQVGELSLQIAGKLIRKNLEGDNAQLEMVDKLLNEVEQKN